MGCGSVGSAVDSDNTGPQFESSHQRICILNIYFLSTVLKKAKIKKMLRKSIEPEPTELCTLSICDRSSLSSPDCAHF